MENKSKTVPDVPCISTIVGRTTYFVYVHFSETSTESMEDKINDSQKNEVMETIKSPH